MIGVKQPGQAAEVADAIDRLFRNSLAETLTETEKAFQMGFVSMTEAIMVAIKIVSYVVIVIIMVVAANTMAMTAGNGWENMLPSRPWASAESILPVLSSVNR